MIARLNKAAERLKISDWGVVKARVFDDLCLDLRTLGIEKEKAERMSNPFLYMEDARSIIVCILSYNSPDAGNISKYAYGSDYHKVILQKLKDFSAPIIESGYKCSYFSDSWDLNERYLAVEAGLGFIGENHMFISPKFGSYVFIGVILTDYPLKPSEPYEGRCLSCGKCISSCPGGALGKDGGFNERKCVSYLTQKKGALSAEEEKLIEKSGYIWGCDICQSVCPYNKSAPYTDIEDFTENKITHLVIDEGMSNREFKRQYSGRAFSWRGKQPLERNQKIMEKNT